MDVLSAFSCAEGFFLSDLLSQTGTGHLLFLSHILQKQTGGRKRDESESGEDLPDSEHLRQAAGRNIEYVL